MLANDQPEIIKFNGERYQRMGGKRRYYLQQTKDRKNAKGLHVAIWEHYSGQKVPGGWHVHHKDGDTFNNDFSNLECIPAAEHARIPKNFDQRNPEHLAHLDRVRPLASEWHRSEEGRAWHSENGRQAYRNRPVATIHCEECGAARQTKRPEITRFCGGRCAQRASAAIKGWPNRGRNRKAAVS